MQANHDGNSNFAMPEPALTASLEGRSSSGSRSNWARTALPAFLLTLYAAQCARFIATQSLTYDEPVHIAEGLDAWRNGRFQDYNDHPPLARLLCTLPLVGPRWQVGLEKLPSGFRIHSIAPDPISLAWRARIVNVMLGLLLGMLLWLAAANMFSTGAANFTLALFAFSPSLVAHFSLVTTDGAATLLIFATALQIARWRKKTTWQNTLLCGFVFGLLLLAKFSTLSMFVLAMFWLLLALPGETSRNRSRWKWRKAVLALLVAAFVLWAGYFFHVSRLTIRHGTLTATHPHWSVPLVKPTRLPLNISLPVPAGEFLAGAREVALNNARGHPAFFLGHISPTGGWKAYYPVTILLKWPLIVILFSVTGLLLCFSGRVRVLNFWILLSFPGLYFVLAIFAHFNIGERHVLPLYPFALLFAAAVWQKFATSSIAKMFLAGILLLNAVDVLRYSPDYLSYFDIFVSPQASYRLLADSNVDWGQGLLSLRQYEREHPDEQISLAYFGSVDPAIYGIRANLLSAGEHANGTVIVSATDLAGEYLRDANTYHWLYGYQLMGILDHCLYVFYVGS
jgi:hypothetical protein